jgi:hypothetical protein
MRRQLSQLQPKVPDRRRNTERNDDVRRSFWKLPTKWFSEVASTEHYSPTTNAPTLSQQRSNLYDAVHLMFERIAQLSVAVCAVCQPDAARLVILSSRNSLPTPQYILPKVVTNLKFEGVGGVNPHKRSWVTPLLWCAESNTNAACHTHVWSPYAD